MKSYTQNDLRKMYETPPRELTDRVQASIASLPCRGQEEKNVKNRISFGLIGVIALLIILMATVPLFFTAGCAGSCRRWFSAVPPGKRSSWDTCKERYAP